MAVLTVCLGVLMLVLNVACWWFPRLNAVANGYGLGFDLTDSLISARGMDVSRLPHGQKAGAALISSVPLLALVRGMRDLSRLFRLYARRDYFPPPPRPILPGPARPRVSD